MKSRNWLLLISLLIVVLLSLTMGQAVITPGELLDIFAGKPTPYRGIFLYIRLPRTLACVLAGAALSVSGAVLQKVLANDLASPGVIGVNAGAGFGVTLCCAMGLLSGWSVSLAAFLGGLLAIGVITLLAYSSGAAKTTVILSGVALNSILSALTETVTVLIPDAAVLNLDFRIGGFASVSYGRLLPAGILIIFAGALLLSLTNELDVISLGDETACSLGLRVRRYRIVFLVLAALLAGAAVSFSGLLGFVGLVVPHVASKLCDGGSRQTLPMSAALGAALVTACDLLARLVFLPYELPVGILMAVIGGPVFVVLLLRRRGGRMRA